jgi:hypothetical protein
MLYAWKSRQTSSFLFFEEVDATTSGLSFKGCFHSGAFRAEEDVFSPPDENCTVCVCLVSMTRSLEPHCVFLTFGGLEEREETGC